jgi:hypothetical protein
MFISRKSRWFAVVATIAIFSTAYAEQNAQTKRELQFEVSTRSIGLSSHPTGAKYVGTFHIIKDRQLSTWIFGISDTPQWKLMSETQRQSIIKVQNASRVTNSKDWRVGSPFSTQSDYTRTPPGTLSYRVYGVSEEDTRLMAEAVIEWLDNQALEKLKGIQKTVENDRAIVAKAQEEIPKLEEECQRLQTQKDEKEKQYKAANYIGWEMYDHAEKSIEELAHNLRSTDFELAGLEARIDLIGKYKSGGKISDQATMIKLNQMLITDEIERAGVLARRNAYEAALKLAKEYRNTVLAFRSASSSKVGWERDLKSAEQEAQKCEEILGNPAPEMRPVQVYENKVTIHPIRTS